MERLEALAEKIKGLPTIMDIEQEISVINGIMALSSRDIVSQKELFYKIIEELELSHTEAYYELTRSNEGIFTNFSHWLTLLSEENKLDLNHNLISTFSMTYDDLMAEISSHERITHNEQQEAV